MGVLLVNLIDLSKRHLLNETEHRVLEQILDAVEHDTKINIRSVAQQSYVSTTTVIKLSKKLGYQGYSDMIYSLRRHAEEERNAAAGLCGVGTTAFLSWGLAFQRSPRHTLCVGWRHWAFLRTTERRLI